MSLSFRPAAKGRPAAADLFPAESESDRGRDTHDAERSLDREKEEDAWLQAGLVVTVTNSELGDGRYHRRTGIVRRVIDEYGGEVHVGADILKLDQDDLQTVPPLPMSCGIAVRGEYKDLRVKVVRMAGGDVEVEIDEGRRAGHHVLLPASHVCQHIAIDGADKTGSH